MSFKFVEGVEERVILSYLALEKCHLNLLRVFQKKIISRSIREKIEKIMRCIFRNCASQNIYIATYNIVYYLP
jgi:hypothetical protein